MKEYELTVLVHPDLEVDPAPALSKIESLITDNGGVIKKKSDKDKKKLAYAIAGQDFAIYYEYDLELPAAAPAKISSVLNITDEVLRYLLVTKDPRKEKYAKIRASRKSASRDNDDDEKDEAEE